MKPTDSSLEKLEMLQLGQRARPEGSVKKGKVKKTICFKLDANSKFGWKVHELIEVTVAK